MTDKTNKNEETASLGIQLLSYGAGAIGGAATLASGSYLPVAFGGLANVVFSNQKNFIGNLGRSLVASTVFLAGGHFGEARNAATNLYMMSDQDVPTIQIEKSDGSVFIATDEEGDNIFIPTEVRRKRELRALEKKSRELNFRASRRFRYKKR